MYIVVIYELFFQKIKLYYYPGLNLPSSLKYFGPNLSSPKTSPIIWDSVNRYLFYNMYVDYSYLFSYNSQQAHGPDQTGLYSG